MLEYQFSKACLNLNRRRSHRNSMRHHSVLPHNRRRSRRSLPLHLKHS